MPKIPCVAAILRNPDAKILLQLRDDKPDLSFSNHWTLPGGKVEEGEAPEEAIYRELIEEIGIMLPLKLWQVYERPHNDSANVEQYIYIGEINTVISSLEMNEGKDLRYFSFADVAYIPIAFGFGALLRRFFEEK